jgi:hypothetical protein
MRSTEQRRARAEQYRDLHDGQCKELHDGQYKELHDGQYKEDTRDKHIDEEERAAAPNRYE